MIVKETMLLNGYEIGAEYSAYAGFVRKQARRNDIRALYVLIDLKLQLARITEIW